MNLDFRKEFNLFISVGPACRPAEALRRAKLREISSPFDWMMAYKLEVIPNFFENGFSNFFSKINEINRNNGNKRFILDKDTGMISMHDFPTNLTYEEFYPMFLEKMTKRFDRLIDSIVASQNICFTGNRDVELCDIENFLSKVDTIFPGKNISFLNVCNSKDSKKCVYNKQGNLEIILFYFDDVYSGPNKFDNWKGNVEEWDIMLSKFSLIKLDAC